MFYAHKKNLRGNPEWYIFRYVSKYRMIAEESENNEKSNSANKEEIAMKKIQVYDPPLCCSTGVCGPSIDEKLVRFAADLDWLKSRGVIVERYNLAQQPGEFVKNSMVKTMLETDGNDCLPIIALDDAIVHKGSYPDRNELVILVGLSVSQTQKLMTAEVRELVAIGAAIACNCEPCFKFHYDKARKLGVSEEDMLHAVGTGIMVKNASADSIKELAYKCLKKNAPDQNPSEKTNSGCSGIGCC
jgi:AhpD family alkylhydroperoxidase